MKRSFIHQFSLKLFTVLAFAALTFGIPSCIGNCGEIEEYFDIEEIDVANYKVISTFTDKLLTTDSVNFEDYLIKCNYRVSYYTYQPKNYNLTNYAYALSCPSLGDLGSLEGIDTILVITKSNYNTDFSKGDTLSKIVAINEKSGQKAYIPLKEFIAENKERIYSQRGFDIKLTEKPLDLTTPYQFDVIVKLGNGEEYASTTQQVFFN